MAVNKVVYGNTTVIDITDTTAEAGDVAQGKEFYAKNGVKTPGTATLGGSFRGAFATKAALDAYTGDKETGDTAIVLTDETTLSHTCRYKYNGTSWDLEEDMTKTQFLASCPIGRCVIFFDSAGSPSDRGLGGGWTQVATAVLRAATNNNTGGEDTHQMTEAEMKQHKHYVRNVNGYVAANQLIATGTGTSAIALVNLASSSVLETLYGEEMGSSSAFSELPVYQNVFVYRRLS